jgi:hypothetical protein
VRLSLARDAKPRRSICFQSLTALCFPDVEVANVTLCPATTSPLSKRSNGFLASSLSQTYNSAGSPLTGCHINLSTTDLSSAKDEINPLMNYQKNVDVPYPTCNLTFSGMKPRRKVTMSNWRNYLWPDANTEFHEHLSVAEQLDCTLRPRRTGEHAASSQSSDKGTRHCRQTCHWWSVQRNIFTISGAATKQHVIQTFRGILTLDIRGPLVAASIPGCFNSGAG